MKLVFFCVVAFVASARTNLHDVCKADVESACGKPGERKNSRHGPQHHNEGEHHQHGRPEHDDDDSHGHRGPPPHLVECIEEKKADFSSACQGALAGDDHKAVRSACRDDFKQHCPKPEHGNEDEHHQHGRPEHGDDDDATEHHGGNRVLRSRGGRGGRGNGRTRPEKSESNEREGGNKRACVEANKSSFSAACVAALDATPRDRQSVKAACAADFAEHCPRPAKPESNDGEGEREGGKGWKRACVEEHKDSFSAACVAALDASPRDRQAVRAACDANFQQFCPRPQRSRSRGGKNRALRGDKQQQGHQRGGHKHGGSSGKHHGKHGGHHQRKRAEHLKQCINEHRATFSQPCQDAMSAHDEAPANGAAPAAQASASEVLAVEMAATEAHDGPAVRPHTAMYAGAGALACVAALVGVRAWRRRRGGVESTPHAELVAEPAEGSAVVVGVPVVGQPMADCYAVKTDV